MSKNTIGKLSVVLTARTAGFQSAMKKAGETVSRFGKMIGVGAVAAGALGAAALAAAAGGLAALAKQQLAVTDVLAKSSDRIGITTEALAGLQHAASLSGVGTDALAKGLIRMNRIIGDAMQGIPAASDALTNLGLSSAELARMRTEDAFADIADRINALGTQAEKTSAVMAIFGKEGASFLNLFGQGSEGIRAAAEEARLLGMSVSRFDAAKIEAANDAVTRLQTVFQGIGRQIAVAVAPAIQMAADRFTDWAKSAGGVGERVRAVVIGVVVAVASLADAWDELTAGIRTAEAAWLRWKAAGLDAIADVAGALGGIARFLPGPLAAPAMALGPGVGGMARAAAAAARAESSGLLAGITTGALGDRIRGFGSGLFDPNASELRPVVDAQAETTEAIRDLTDEVRRQTDTLRDALGRATPGDSASLIRVLDRLAIGLSGPSTRSLVGVT